MRLHVRVWLRNWQQCSLTNKACQGQMCWLLTSPRMLSVTIYLSSFTFRCLSTSYALRHAFTSCDVTWICYFFLLESLSTFTAFSFTIHLSCLHHLFPNRVSASGITEIVFKQQTNPAVSPRAEQRLASSKHWISDCKEHGSTNNKVLCAFTRQEVVHVGDGSLVFISGCILSSRLTF